MLQVSNLSFEYPNKRVLDNVSFSINKGSITALVGPNGAGKTTLLRLISGLETPFSGDISMQGVNVVEDKKLAHDQIGYLSDFFGVHEELTIEQCLIYAARIRNVAEGEITTRIKETARQLGLDGRMKEKAGSLSRGLRQRLGIAQAIIHSPALVILDEPASGLDPEARISLSGLMKQLKAEGMTLLVSSHILSELEDYCTDIVILRDGKIAGQNDLKTKEVTARRKVEVQFAALNAEQEEKLKQLVPGISLNGAGASFEIAADDAAQAEALQLLVKNKLPIIQFFVRQKTMQDVYMDVAAKEKR